MTKKQRYNYIIDYFSKHNPNAASELEYENAYQLLAAVILSAQCTDKRVNTVTPPLFAAYPTPKDLKEASVEAIFNFIKSVSYPNNKAKHLKGMATVLVNKFNGIVPDTVEDLQELPGVGRKTANLVRALAFGKPAICVDVHVHRICNRLGFVKTKTPLETEMALRKKLPLKYWIDWNSHLVAFGQTCCRPVKPHCAECPIARYCASNGS